MITKALVKSVGALVIVSLLADVARADVFNMGGTQNADGTWNGLASLQFVTVGDAGNAADAATGSLYGSVGYNYQIGKYDVTVGQYCQFLNAVATTDTYGLYNSHMATDYPTIGITQSGSAGSYSYSVTGAYNQAANCPVFDVTWGDAARFCNWLSNGQPTGAEGNGVTETGSYTLNGAITEAALMAVTRNVGATYVIPTENEWYKAAYYKGGGLNQGYWTYPTKSNTAPSNVLSSTGTNNANFYNNRHTDPTNYLTPVGTFSASPGPYGTYDMGGDVWQWNETAVYSSRRGGRGGSCTAGLANILASSTRGYNDPTSEYSYNGFRVASVPEPGSLTLLFTGAIGILAYGWRRRRA
jgi:formylglycine-generating enzyme